MNDDRVTVVTGAAGGIGAAVVARLLADGDTVIATDNNADGLSALRRDRPDAGRLLTIVADISREDDCDAVAQLARDRADRLDVLVNCAGYFPFRPFEQMTPGDWRQVIDINLTGTFLMTRAAVPLMKQRGWGRIISFGSGGYFVGVPAQAHYIAAKAGIVGFSRSIARELGQHGITVNVVTPGVTLTPNAKQTAPPALLEAQRRARGIHRDEYPEDLVGTVAFLASPDAAFITGQTINVDGGANAT
ncbi:SDR family NAD(P)-dependent oxidoreductase [Actinoplanes sp. NPDC049265]|uniref:SDR family NAD(P)-dependent oxidoreductase n=1 Tax=Actinoplanes sp. NPDC049265 TaxID=3363902 RepID=UPI0037173FC5